MRADLHTHTSFSDGTDSPSALILQSVAAGLNVVAITDHDTMAGWGEAEEALASLPSSVSLGLMRGTEISCARLMPQYRIPVTVHLLSYLHDPHDPELNRVLAGSRDSREGRAREMVRRIGGDFDFGWDDIEGELELLSDEVTVGRPHIADALVRRGYVADRAEAFERILSPRSPYFVHHSAPDPVDAVRMVRAAGGVPVFAHPAARIRGRVVDAEAIAAMADAGLAGLEVDHRDHTPEAQVALRGLAADLGLMVTGSSDFHGDGKPNRLGENLTSEDVVHKIAEQGVTPMLWAGVPR